MKGPLKRKVMQGRKTNSGIYGSRINEISKNNMLTEFNGVFNPTKCVHVRF